MAICVSACGSLVERRRVVTGGFVRFRCLGVPARGRRAAVVGAVGDRRTGRQVGTSCRGCLAARTVVRLRNAERVRDRFGDVLQRRGERTGGAQPATHERREGADERHERATRCGIFLRALFCTTRRREHLLLERHHLEVLLDDVFARHDEELAAQLGEQRSNRGASGVVARSHRTASPVTRLANAASARRCVVFTAPGLLAEHVRGVGDREIGDVAQQHDGALVGRQRFERTNCGRRADSIEHLVIAVVGGRFVL